MKLTNTLFYSPSTGGFYHSGIHDSIPADAVKVNDELHSSLMEAQQEGKLIVPGKDGIPEAIDAPPLTGNALIKSQIHTLEKQADTPRRRREAINGEDSGWMKNVSTQIATLRAQLTEE